MPENPKLWREMQEPHESIDAVNKASNKFFDELGALREKYRLSDVMVVARVNYKDGESEQQAIIPVFYGETLRAEAMSAFAYGHYANERQAMISDLISKAVRTRQKDRK